MKAILCNIVASLCLVLLHANAVVASTAEFSVLERLGVKGKVITEEAFNNQQKDAKYAALNRELPVKLPGFLIESVPSEDVFTTNELKEISELKSGEWLFLIEPEVRKIIREMILRKHFVIVSKSTCDRVGMAMGKGHRTLERWKSALGIEMEGAILLSYCASPHVVLHEYFHLLQFNWTPGSEASIYFQDLVDRVAGILGEKNAKYLGDLVYPFIEAQASYYSVKKMRLLYPTGFPHLSYVGSERHMLSDYSQQFGWMIGRIRYSVDGDLKKREELIKMYSEIFPLGGDSFHTSPIGWNSLYCYYEEKQKWIKDVPSFDNDLTLPIGAWQVMDAVTVRTCSQKMKELD